mmetsp:Transcript_21011/g.34733  ORF Transcript_21011/g.34733 Transcript_21011/m.34733 type:complete len:324 (+) Transcript_21011:81-1052(+)|eukprot:CAMPEP_0119006424 /NCGR_PEP_ID=MMETSP1176-20130426/2285_1 /TAXON_ID=265551 /ORGANISM="Synedropsis recta cf, Strain CCMP1620" /LENGTH=323 /DNA_ID=CAMNT_0006958333 /DNA_START=47 /DNA_END=1018 /DNA_ORIENTATION=+
MPPSKRNRKKIKLYAVAVGRKPGIYETWDDCKEQTEKFKAAKFKSFDTKTEAQEFVDKYKVQERGSATVDNAQSKEEASARPVKKARREPNHIISIWIHFDGGSRGNPGLGGAGAQVVVVTEKITPHHRPPRQEFQKDALSTPSASKQQIFHVRKYLGSRGVTNNQAEYHGMLAGLDEGLLQMQSFVEKYKHDATTSRNNRDPEVFAAKLKVKGDSNLILQQMKGEYQVHSEKLVPLHKDAGRIVSKMKHLMECIEIDYDHVYRADNAIADGLANEAMDSQKSWTSVVASRNVTTTTSAVRGDMNVASRHKSAYPAVEGGVDV